jgi:hypothetical protein
MAMAGQYLPGVGAFLAGVQPVVNAVWVNSVVQENNKAEVCVP